MAELPFLFFVLSCTTVSTINAEPTLKNKASKTVVDKRQIVKVSKDNDAMTNSEVRT